MNKRSKIIARIKALQAKTTGRGATEAEAAAAARKAAELIAEHQIVAGDIAASDYGVTILDVKGVRKHASQSHPCVYAARGAEHISGARIYLSPRGFVAVGDEASVRIAGYLLDLVYAAINSAWGIERAERVASSRALWSKHIGLPPPSRFDKDWHDDLRAYGLAHDHRARQSFGVAMASRMSERMLAMPPARPAPAEIVLRLMGRSEEPAASKGVNEDFDSSSVRAGLRAGADAPIGLGVGAQAAAQLIGGAGEGGQ